MPTREGAYLATFTYRIPEDALGNFAFEVLYDGQSANPKERTFLFGSYARAVDVDAVMPARVHVVDRHQRGKRLSSAD